MFENMVVISVVVISVVFISVFVISMFSVGVFGPWACVNETTWVVIFDLGATVFLT